MQTAQYTPVIILPLVTLAICELCDAEVNAAELSGISNQDDADRIAGLLEVDPDACMCKGCRDALIAEAHEAVCHHCHRPECPGPIIRTDVDRYECPGLGFRARW